jgi:ribose-phosphate pyrophosphokinase
MMEFLVRKRLVVFSGTSHPELAKEVVNHLGIELGDVDIHRFANGEIYTRFMDSVRGTDAFIIQTHSHPINEHIMEMLIMLDALKRASAARVTAVVPYYGYSRQDKKQLAREPISAKLMADLIHTAGADRVMAIDLHAGQIQGFFDFPFDHLTALPILVEHLRGLLGEGVVVVSPDAGRVGVADRYARRLGGDLAIVHKRRDPERHNVSQALDVVGEVSGRRCVLVDDMIDTAGTICNAAEALVRAGAAEVYAAATHPILSGPAIQRLMDSPIRRVVVTNSLPVPAERGCEKLDVISVGPIIAEAIRAIFEEESVSGLFGGDNW